MFYKKNKKSNFKKSVGTALAGIGITGTAISNVAPSSANAMWWPFSSKSSETKKSDQTSSDTKELLNNKQPTKKINENVRILEKDNTAYIEVKDTNGEKTTYLVTVDDKNTVTACQGEIKEFKFVDSYEVGIDGLKDEIKKYGLEIDDKTQYSIKILPKDPKNDKIRFNIVNRKKIDENYAKSRKTSRSIVKDMGDVANSIGNYALNAYSNTYDYLMQNYGTDDENNRDTSKTYNNEKDTSETNSLPDEDLQKKK